MKLLVFLGLLWAATVNADNSNVVRVEGLSIQGGTEEPHVMHVTPWREPPGTGRLYEDAASQRMLWVQSIDLQQLRQDMNNVKRIKKEQPAAGK